MLCMQSLVSLNFFKTSSLVTVLSLLSFCSSSINSFNRTSWTNSYTILPVRHDKFSQACFKNLSLNVGLRSKKGGFLSSMLEQSGKLTKDLLLRQNCQNHLMIVFPFIHVLVGKSDSGKLPLSSWFLIFSAASLHICCHLTLLSPFFFNARLVAW